MEAADIDVDITEAEPQKKRISLAEAFEKDTPRDGSVFIGKGGPDKNVYHTRFRINRKAQRHHLSRAVFKESCTPCLVSEEKSEDERSCGRLAWQLISSEAVIFTLHIIVLSLGVAKEALDLRVVAEDVHLAHSLVETFITCLVIVIRVCGVRQLYMTIKQHVIQVEYVSDPHSTQIHGRKMVLWLRVIYALGGFLILLSVACFILFYFLVHLGWTILSNNFCLLLITVTTNLFQDRLSLVMSKIREDQHKAVIYETILLLKESYAAAADPIKHKEYFQKAQDFTLAVAETELFTKPDHIFIDNNSLHKMDDITNMQMQSFI